MKALVVEKVGRLRWRDWPTSREIGPGEALIRTTCVGLCATDLALIRGKIVRGGFPKVLGHEWSGVVEQVGRPEDEVLVGMRVVGENHLTCLRCPACREGRWNACPEAQEVGFELPGGYAQRFVTRTSHLHVLPDGLSPEEAALIEPLAVSLYGMERTGVRAGERVGVFGDGPIGLLCVQVARCMGASEVILLGGRSGRLALGVRLGASEGVNYHEVHGALGEALRSRFGRMEVCMEASGSVRGLEAALAWLGFDGRIGVLGDYGEEGLSIRPTEWIRRNVQLVASNATAGTWDRAMALATSRVIRLKELVSAVFPIEQYEEAFALAEGRSDAAKVVLRHADG